MHIGRFHRILGEVWGIAAASHPMAGITICPGPVSDRARAGDYFGQIGGLVIGHDVWDGDGARMPPGADRARLSVVTFPSKIVAGNPGRVIRLRFDADMIAWWMTLALWHLSIGRIARRTAPLARADIAAPEEFAA